MFTTLSANVLNDKMFTISDNELQIKSETQLRDYILKVGDENLTNEFLAISKPMQELFKTESLDANITSYEEAFAKIRFLYYQMVSRADPIFIDDHLKLLAQKKQKILNKLLEAKRLNINDATALVLVVEYLNARNSELNLLAKRKIAYAEADFYATNILTAQYTFLYNKDTLIKENEQLNKQLKTAVTECKKANIYNEILINNLRIAFIDSVKQLQHYYMNKSWNNADAPSFGYTNQMPTIITTTQQSLECSAYDGNLSIADIEIQNAKINTHISKVTIEIHKKQFLGIEWTMLKLKAQQQWNNFKNVILFTIDNNSVQVGDIASFLKLLIGAVAISFIISYLLTKIIKGGVALLWSLIIRFIISFYLIFYFATQVLGLDSSNLAMFASAFSIAIGFGMQSLIQNFIAGLIVIGDKTIQIGDSIDVLGGPKGKVVTLSYRTTTIKTSDNTFIMLPNSMLLTQAVENKTKNDPRIKVRVNLFLANDVDLEFAENVLQKTCTQIAGICEESAPSIGVASMSADGVEVEVSFLVKDSSYANEKLITKTLHIELKKAIRSLIN